MLQNSMKEKFYPEAHHFSQLGSTANNSWKVQNVPHFGIYEFKFGFLVLWQTQLWSAVHIMEIMTICFFQFWEPHKYLVWILQNGEIEKPTKFRKISSAHLSASSSSQCVAGPALPGLCAAWHPYTGDAPTRSASLATQASPAALSPSLTSFALSFLRANKHRRPPLLPPLEARRPAASQPLCPDQVTQTKRRLLVFSPIPTIWREKVRATHDNSFSPVIPATFAARRRSLRSATDIQDTTIQLIPSRGTLT